MTKRLTIDDIPEEQRTRAEIWSRVMGYHRPINLYNIGKKQEQKERVDFSMNATFNS